jgi:hypothetical protein
MDSLEALTAGVLRSLCSSACLDDITSLARTSGEACRDDVLRIQLDNVSFAEVGQLVKERTDLLCLRESEPEGPFCHEVMSR